MKKHIVNPFRQFWSHDGNHGSIMVEFAMIVPIFLILIFPVVDYSRYILIQQKAVKAAAFMGDAVAMSQAIEATTTQADIDTNGLLLKPEVLAEVVDTLDVLMMPFESEATSGKELYQAVITQVYRAADGAARIGWQYDQNSKSFYGARESIVGVVGGAGDIGSPATLPAAIAATLDDGENLIVVEISALYRPITPDLQVINVPFLQEKQLKYTSYYRARYGNLRCVWNTYMPPDCMN
jgi:hypothetical protein